MMKQVFLSKILHGVLDGVALSRVVESLRERPPLPSSGAQPKLWRRLQRARERRRNVHGLREPTGNGALDQLIIGKFARRFAELVRELRGALQLFAKRCARLQPAKPSI